MQRQCLRGCISLQQAFTTIFDDIFKKTTSFGSVAQNSTAINAGSMVFQAGFDLKKLPQGVIHADLFRDNVLWDGEFVGGVIDFYFAGVDALLFDVAVTANDWCADADGRLDPALTSALLEGYAESRPFTAAERAAWPAMLRAAALRFWLSRLEDFHRPRAGEMVLVKDPGEYRRILHQRATDPALPALPV